MPKRLLPTEYVVTGACTPQCSLSKVKLGESRAALVHSWIEQGQNDFKVEELAHAAGFRLSHGSVGRHKAGHLVEKHKMAEDPSLGTLSDVEALEAILKRGQVQIPSWRITPTEYFKAMEMKYRLTGGSEVDGMMSALARAAAEVGEEEDAESNLRPGPVGADEEGPGSIL